MLGVYCRKPGLVEQFPRGVSAVERVAPLRRKRKLVDCIGGKLGEVGVNT